AACSVGIPLESERAAGVRGRADQDMPRRESATIDDVTVSAYTVPTSAPHRTWLAVAAAGTAAPESPELRAVGTHTERPAPKTGDVTRARPVSLDLHDVALHAAHAAEPEAEPARVEQTRERPVGRRLRTERRPRGTEHAAAVETHDPRVAEVRPER